MTKIYSGISRNVLENTVLWRHNGRDGVSNDQPHDCLLNCSFRRGSKKTSKLHVAGPCGGNSFSWMKNCYLIPHIIHWSFKVWDPVWIESKNCFPAEFLVNSESVYTSISVMLYQWFSLNTHLLATALFALMMYTGIRCHGAYTVKSLIEGAL